MKKIIILSVVIMLLCGACSLKQPTITQKQLEEMLKNKPAKVDNSLPANEYRMGDNLLTF